MWEAVAVVCWLATADCDEFIRSGEPFVAEEECKRQIEIDEHNPFFTQLLLSREGGGAIKFMCRLKGQDV